MLVKEFLYNTAEIEKYKYFEHIMSMNNRIVNLLLGGYEDVVIAKILNCSIIEVFEALEMEIPNTAQPYEPFYSSEVATKVIKAFRSGKTMLKISVEFNYPYSTVRKILLDNNCYKVRTYK